MTQPPGFIHPQLPHHVCKLQRSLYGLHQAPKAWFSRLTDQLQAIGFINSQANHSLYIYHQGSTLIYLLIYVDDIILAGDDMQSIKRVIQLLQNKFAVKDIGDLTFFLGIEAIRDASGLHLS
jgi:histone deacetylase 1/2